MKESDYERRLGYESPVASVTDTSESSVIMVLSMNETSVIIINMREGSIIWWMRVSGGERKY